MSVNFDYIIIGGGSSGAALASVLATKGHTLLIERGANHTAYVGSTVRQGWPQIAAVTLDTLKNDGSGHMTGTANILGGGSALNGAVCWRSENQVFESLGFDLQTVEKKFQMLEDEICSPSTDTEVNQAFIHSWEEYGFQTINNSSGYASWANPGNTTMTTIQRARTTLPLSGRRRVASHLFESRSTDSESSILDQGNLTVFLLTHVKRVLFNEDKEASGADIISPSGDFSVYVRKGGKVFLNAGAYETPKLLMLSGIGPSDMLSRFNIPLVHRNEEVGKNLIDRKEFVVMVPLLKALGGDDTAILDIALISEKYWTSIAHKYSTEWGNAFQGCLPCAIENRTLACRDQMVAALTFYGINKESNITRGIPLFVAQRYPVTRGRLSLASAEFRDSPIVHDGWSTSINDLSSDAQYDLSIIIDAVQKAVIDVIRDTSILERLGHPATPDKASGNFSVEVVNALSSVRASFILTNDELDKCTFAPPFISDEICTTWEECIPTIPSLPKDHNELKTLVFSSLSSIHHIAGTCKAGAVVERGTLAVKGVEGLYISDLSVVSQPVDIHPMMTAMALGLLLGDSIESIPVETYEPFPVVFSLICLTIIVALISSWIISKCCRSTEQTKLNVEQQLSGRLGLIWNTGTPMQPLDNQGALNEEEEEIDADTGEAFIPNVRIKNTDVTEASKNTEMNPDSTALLTWGNVSCTYKTGKRGKKPVTTLFKSFGRLKEGEITAVMGPSGAAKSTLVDILAGRKTVGKIEGTFSALGNTFNASTDGLAGLSKTIEGNSAYIPQQEYFYPTQTCEEAVSFAANIKLGRGDPAKRRCLINSCLSIVGLNATEYASRKIGGDLVGGISIRGLSGGERKRLALACVLPLKPKFIFIDEITSGLDSENAFLIMKLLKDLSVKRRVSSMVIVHQPDPAIFALFDKLILLSRGRTVFSDSCIHLEKFYQHNYGENLPMDVYLAGDLISKASTFDEVNNTMDLYRGDDMNHNMKERTTQTLVESVSYNNTAHNAPPGVMWKLFVVFQRNLVNQYVRNLPNFGARLASYSALSAIVGAIFWQVGTTDSERGLTFEEASNVIRSTIFLLNISYLLPFASMPVFAADKKFLAAESALGLYNTWIYGASQLFLEFLVLALISTVETAIVFFMCGMANPTLPAWISFFTVMSILTVSGLVGSTVVLCCSIWLSTQDLAFLVGSTICTISLALSGGFLPSSEMPDVPAAIQWISPVKYSYQGLLIAQLTGTSAETILQVSEYNTPPTVSANLVVLCIFFVIIAVLTAIGMNRVKEVR